MLTPYIIRTLGTSQYGIYTLVGALIPYFTLLDLGLSRTVTRYVAHYRAVGDRDSEQRFIATAVRLYIIIIAILLVLGFILYQSVDILWGKHFNQEELHDIKLMILIVVVSQSIIIPGNIFTAICNGSEHFAFPRLIQPIKYILRALCVVLLLWQGEKATALILLDAILNIAVVLATYIYVRKLYNNLSLLSNKQTKLGPVLKYSLWITLYSTTYTLQWNIAQLITGMTNTTTWVGITGVGILLGSMYGYFAETINRMMMPQAARLIESHPTAHQLTADMIRTGRIVAIPQLCILGGFILFGKNFITLWAGEIYAPAYPITLIMMVLGFVQLTQDYGNSLLEAKGVVRTMSIYNFIVIFAGALVSYFVSQQYGAIGMMLVLGGSTIVVTLANNIYYKKKLRLNTATYFRATYAKAVAITSLVVVIIELIKEYILPTHTWIGILLGCILYILIFAILIYTIVLTSEEKQLIKSICSKR